MTLVVIYAKGASDDIDAAFDWLAARAPSVAADFLQAIERAEVHLRRPWLRPAARHHPIVRMTGNATDEITGTVFRITPAELAAADSYEVAAYKRVAVRLKSGLEAFVYGAA